MKKRGRATKGSQYVPPPCYAYDDGSLMFKAMMDKEVQRQVTKSGLIDSSYSECTAETKSTSASAEFTVRNVDLSVLYLPVESERSALPTSMMASKESEERVYPSQKRASEEPILNIDQLLSESMFALKSEKSFTLRSRGESAKTVEERPGLSKEVSFRLQENCREQLEVEISPGAFSPLRGSEETMKAIESNFLTPSTCMGCNADLVCIADAKFIICPLCRVTGFVQGGCKVAPGMKLHGVGIGVLPSEI